MTSAEIEQFTAEKTQWIEHRDNNGLFYRCESCGIAAATSGWSFCPICKKKVDGIISRWGW